MKKTDSNWIGILSIITKQYINRVQISTKLTPIQASLKKNEGYIYHKLLDKQKALKPKFQVNNLVRTAGLKRFLSKGDTPNWYHKLYKITKFINDTIPNDRIDNLKER